MHSAKFLAKVCNNYVGSKELSKNLYNIETIF